MEHSSGRSSEKLRPGEGSLLHVQGMSQRYRPIQGGQHFGDEAQESWEKARSVSSPNLGVLHEYAETVLKESIINVRNTGNYIRRSFAVLFGMYVALFIIGIATAVVAVIKGFGADTIGKAGGAFAIAGLSAASFFSLFLTRPLDSLERNGIYRTWLVVATNTYWTRLMYFSNPATIDQDLENATEQFVASVTRLDEQYANFGQKDRSPRVKRQEKNNHQ